jgi:predicted nucleic acid-binding Zn ribbon protein
MAIYTWHCKVCGDLMEVERPMADYDKPVHNDAHDAKCDGEYVRKITQVAVPFEGLRDKGIFERVEKHF